MATVDTSTLRWRKSSRSDGEGNNGNCVEVALVAPTAWRKSSRSTNQGSNGDCIEVADLGPATAIRDSKNPAGPFLVLPAASWSHFLPRD